MYRSIAYFRLRNLDELRSMKEKERESRKKMKKKLDFFEFFCKSNYIKL